MIAVPHRRLGEAERREPEPRMLDHIPHHEVRGLTVIDHLGGEHRSQRMDAVKHGLIV